MYTTFHCELFKYISTNKSDILKTEDNFRDNIENNIVMHTITTRNINSGEYIGETGDSYCCNIFTCQAIAPKLLYY